MTARESHLYVVPDAPNPGAPATQNDRPDLQFEGMLDLVPTGCLLVDTFGVLHRANAAARDLLGVHEIRRTRPVLAAFIAPQQITEFYAFVRQAGSSDAPSAIELRLRRGERELFWARLEGRRFVGQDGAPLALLTVVDISQQRRSEDQRRSSEARLRVLMDSLPDAVFVLRRGSLVYANSAGARFLGSDAAALVGRAFSDFVVGSKDRLLAALSVERASDETVGPLELRIRRAGERTLATAETVWIPVEFDGDACTLCVLRDQTETRHLQARLGQSDRLATVGVLAAGVAHEINNPLAYVMMSLDELMLGLQEADAKELAPLAEQAIEGTRRVARIVDELRSFARDDESSSAVDINHVIQKAVSLAAPKTRHRADVRLGLGQIPPVMASEGRMVQVLLNLVVNASQAIESETGGLIDVRTAFVRGMVRITVQDNGRGIPLDVRDRIFEPFVTTKEVGEGSGLGLFVCHKYVSEYGGKIELESDVGVGTTVHVWLPALPGGVLPRPGSPTPARLEAVASSAKMLVIDDEAPIRHALAQALARYGSVQAVESVEEAISVLNADASPDLILCDLHLPVRTGADFHRWILEHRPELADRLALMTGGACTRAAQEFLHEAEIPVLCKPFSLQQLRAFVLPRLRDEPGQARDDAPSVHRPR